MLIVGTVRWDSRPTLVRSNQLPLDVSPRFVVHSKEKQDLMQTSLTKYCYSPEIPFLSPPYTPISVIWLGCCCG